ncbi:MAG: PIN domain-containing protein [Microcystis viridis Mv_BB_P_19951000_S69]|uniref:PIN domain-containing protein n=1 Tax=Microcystis viridis Mv_BB_P_19951000_S68D TaxID=2486270 RepID=A0A552HEP8_MICVR|nr:MAG: PIN domain-containing protein [Microcystis viridis Mv_BB_P_19951000_S68D]TRU74950.1 MAG: PIN domain-containing protein [Microcystis viridis Mv_BB_P_19951000_S69]TRU78887.1 MAG: PIN domain-containing protein [Microcystis viridis Mv_BB_P_19951000_S68]TRU88645.1 MAG: PIN domain-containing protein [Microcystis viridis Mv_BB_P_19951000_S69D]
MTNSLYFCDSNIWLYRLLIDPECNESEEIRKHNLAAALTSRKNILITRQIINKVCSVLSKKAKISEIKIRQIIQEFYDGCLVIQLDRNIILRASELRNHYSFSFWDSLIVASALATDANILDSEDMQDRLIISNQLTLN